MTQSDDGTGGTAGPAPERESNAQPDEPNLYSQLKLPPNPYSAPPEYAYGPTPYEYDPYTRGAPPEPNPYIHPAPGSSAQNAPPPYPPPPPPRKRNAAPWIAGAGVLVLLIGGSLAGISFGAATHAPEVQVQAFLDALVEGNAEQAIALTGTEVGPGDLLLSNEAYQNADDRITGYTIGDSRADGDSASVTATIKQGGFSYDEVFSLTRTGRDAVVFDVWALDPPAISILAVGVSAPDDAVVEVGAVDVSPARSGDGVELRALPGTYAVTLGGDTTWYDAEPTSASVVGFGARAEPAESLAVDMTDEGTRSATDAVDAWLDDCVASTELAPAGCPFSASNPGDLELSNIAWTVTKPEFSFGDFTDGSWPVVSETVGEAVATADGVDPETGETGRTSTQPIPFDIRGVIDGFTDEGAAFDPAP